MIRNHLFSLLAFCILISAGCDSGMGPYPPTTDSTKYTVDFTFSVWNLRRLRDGEFYSLWIKHRPDTAWRLLSDTSFNRFPSQDSFVIFGRNKSAPHPDSIYEAMITIELTKHPQQPSDIVLLKGSVTRDTGYLTMNHLGDFSKASGGLTFTSQSPDTSAFRKEFYLLRFAGPAIAPALANFPVLPAGWRYGLWAVDYEFFPYHEFLYGLFDTPSGHDNDSAGDAYAYPGGAKKQPMDVKSGQIIVTLEPPLYGDSLRYHGAELLHILQFNRTSNIEPDRFYPMANVASEWLPSGRIVFTKR